MKLLPVPVGSTQAKNNTIIDEGSHYVGQAGKRVIIDEAGYYFGDNNNDPLREELREIDGVPNAAYVVDDNRVFVFAKLVSLVNEKLASLPLEGDQRKQAILSLVPEAWVTPHSAVSDWGVVPEPYKVENEDGRFYIRHSAFNAQIPTFFESREALNKALSLILIGGVVDGGAADFSYQGQPFKLIAPFCPSSLPSLPDFGADLGAQDPADLLDPAPLFIDGFPPLTQEKYIQICGLKESWERTTNAAIAHVFASLSSLPTQLQHFALDTLVGTESDMSGVGDCVSDLRAHYPELTMLTDSALYDGYDSYQGECRYIRGWDVYRDDDFLFYLIGQAVSDRKLEGEVALDVGRSAVFFSMQGTEASEAANKAMQWKEYDTALFSLYWRSRTAMSYLQNGGDIFKKRGSEIVTFRDLFRIGRKTSVVTQKAGDFSRQQE